MSTDCDIYLPAYVTVDDVATVIGMLLGCAYEKVPLSDHAWYLKVERVEVEVTSVPEMCRIMAESKLYGRGHWCYHFECDLNGRNLGERLLSTRSEPLMLAVAVGVAKVFGGKVIYSDHTGKSRRFEGIPNAGRIFRSNEQWDRWQEAMAAVKPIGAKDIERVRKYAAYSEGR